MGIVIRQQIDHLGDVGAGPGPAADLLDALFVNRQNQHFCPGLALAQPAHAIVNLMLQGLQDVKIEKNIAQNRRNRQDYQQQG